MLALLAILSYPEKAETCYSHFGHLYEVGVKCRTNPNMGLKFE